MAKEPHDPNPKPDAPTSPETAEIADEEQKASEESMAEEPALPV